MSLMNKFSTDREKLNLLQQSTNTLDPLLALSNFNHDRYRLDALHFLKNTEIDLPSIERLLSLFSHDSYKLLAIKSLNLNNLNPNQITQILTCLTLDSSRLEFLNQLNPNLFKSLNLITLLSLFTRDSYRIQVLSLALPFLDNIPSICSILRCFTSERTRINALNLLQHQVQSSEILDIIALFSPRYKDHVIKLLELNISPAEVEKIAQLSSFDNSSLFFFNFPMPEMPAMPPMPPMPAMPAMPEMPEMPEMPAMPPMPAMPNSNISSSLNDWLGNLYNGVNSSEQYQQQRMDAQQQRMDAQQQRMETQRQRELVQQQIMETRQQRGRRIGQIEKEMSKIGGVPTEKEVNERKEDEIEQGKRNEESENICVICLEAVRIYLLRPCNHMCLCTSCAREIGVSDNCKCPVCRQEINDFIYVMKP